MRFGLMRSWPTIALIVGAAPLAVAQTPMNNIGNFGNFGRPAPAPSPQKTAPPPALPGAASTGAAAQPSRSPSDMEPTDALFDAINRGDIGAARDAISRGADLRGQNVLGMTPLELSVDLGRNDISFMLLSMRETGDDRAHRLPAAQQAAKPPPAKQARQVPARSAAKATAAAPAPAQTARLFTGDGGTPNPNAGFLGFDSSRR